MLSLTVVFIILVQAVASHGGSYCNNGGVTFFCGYKCCGVLSNQYCCSGGNSAETTATVALIIGIVCSAVLTIVVIVGLVICCVRCCRSSKGHQGQVIATGQPMAVIATTGSNTTPGAYNAGYSYPSQPAPGIHYTQPAGTAQPPPSYPPGPLDATETGQAKATPEGVRIS